VLIYSLDYLNGDPYHVKFFSYLNFFAFSMLTMVLSKNYLVMFLGWEGVGLASYLLVNFWDTRNLANKSALKAVIFNRIGDIFFFAFLALMFIGYGSFDFSVIFPLASQVKYQLIFGFSFNEILSLFILIAAMAKSAQIFLHPWLPDAMEGPTPVSALLHSATMVTAGLFLILRSFSIISTAPVICFCISIIGLATSLISSFTGLYQYDIKRIIAFSTCSQLGFILFSIGLGNLKFGLFHLFNHAFFKALLFLCAGSVIHACMEQDIRKMGGLWKFLPLTYVTMLVASLSLAGFPFLSGYYSKDLVLQGSYALLSNFAISIAVISAISSFLSSFYSFRLIYFVFFGENHINKNNLKSLHEGSFYLYFPLIVLCIFSIVSGFFFKDIFILSGFFKNSLFSPIGLDRISDVEFISEKYGIHPLLTEDILSVGQRPKTDEIEGVVFCLLNMLYQEGTNYTVETEQISIILGKDFVISIQEDPKRDVFNLIRDRLRLQNSKLRQSQADYLCYSMIDLIVDHYYLVLEKLGDQIENIEDEIIRYSNTRSLAK
ncbi:NADH-quinone oxidoreductase subunit L, partial [bacterium]